MIDLNSQQNKMGLVYGTTEKQKTDSLISRQIFSENLLKQYQFRGI